MLSEKPPHLISSLQKTSIIIPLSFEVHASLEEPFAFRAAVSSYSYSYYPIILKLLNTTGKSRCLCVCHHSTRLNSAQLSSTQLHQLKPKTTLTFETTIRPVTVAASFVVVVRQYFVPSIIHTSFDKLWQPLAIFDVVVYALDAF